MSSENIKLSIIGGLFLIALGLYNYPGKPSFKKIQSKKIQGSSTSTIDDAVDSLKESVDDVRESIDSFDSSNYSKSGGSRRRCKKGCKRKTKGRNKR